MLVFSSIGTELRVLHSVAHKVDFGFDFGDNVPLKLVNLVRHGISHGANGLSQDGTLAFDPVHFLAEQECALSVLGRRLSALALLAATLLLGGLNLV